MKMILRRIVQGTDARSFSIGLYESGLIQADSSVSRSWSRGNLNSFLWNGIFRGISYTFRAKSQSWQGRLR